LKIENTEVFGFRSAFRAMRNPKDSWGRDDSKFYMPLAPPAGEDLAKYIHAPENPNIGPNDLKLALKLIRGGSPHRKFLRQIMVWSDWTLPRYVWQEADTYKVATVRNSCSTMHKLGSRPLTPEDFQDEDVLPEVLAYLNQAGEALRAKAEWIPPNTARRVLRGEEIKRWMKKHMPEGFLQKATMTFSYETLLAMHRWRATHRLPEWSGVPSVEWHDAQFICEWIRSLPYMEQFIAASER